MTEFFSKAAEYFPILLQGAKLTVLVTLGSLALSTVLGLVWAVMRVSGPFKGGGRIGDDRQ